MRMQQFDKDLAECLIERPSEYLEQLELAAADVLAASRHREDNGEEPARTRDALGATKLLPLSDIAG